MNFLDKLVIPLSPEHIVLLHYILMLIFFLFIPYISIILGGTALSLYYRIKGKGESNSTFERFAEDVIETVTINKGMGIILGLISLLTAILLYVQMFHDTSVATVNYLGASFVLLAVGLALVYTYRYSLTFGGIFDSLKDYSPADKKVAHDIAKIRKSSNSLSVRSGVFGLIFVFFAAWLFVAGVTLAVFPDQWGKHNVLSLMFSGFVISKFILFLLVSGAFTGAALLFGFFYWDGGKEDVDEDYGAFVRKISLRLTFTASLIIPIFMLINIVILPDSALSGAVFFYATLALLMLFLAYNFMFQMIKTSTVKYSVHVFILVLFTIMAIVIKDQVAMGNSNQLQNVVLAANFEKTMQSLTGGEQAAAPEVSGEQIYKTICSSCHSFDHKVVGPPYKQTLPKYKGDVDKLVKFVLNPTQNNPGYPPMPNPGLNPTQARAVATYILKEVKKYE